MKFLLAIFITIVCAMYDDANGARILMMTPHQAKSHYIVYEALLKRLAERGHQVVSFNHFPQKTVLPNFTDVDISSSMPYVVGTRSIELAYKRTMWQKLKSISHLSLPTCESVLEHPELKKLLHSKEKFDVYIMEIFLSDCFIGIGHALKIPIVVGVSSTVSYPWTNDILRNPDIPSYIPNSVLSNFSDEMNFFERATNLMYLFISKLAYRYLADRPGYEIAKKHFGDDLPDLDTLRSKMSLILTNGHRAVNTPRALAPEYKELGGMHIPASGPPPLPKDLKDFLDSSENGVIYFSLGSQINMSTLPNEVLMSFYEAFERVPQRILWKCIESNMPRLPKKVKCIEWAPQLSILFWAVRIGPITLMPIVLLIGTILGIIVFLITDKDRIPKFHNAFAFFGFFTAMMVVYLVAKEVMAVLQCVGYAFSISDAMLGITLLAWGNSIGDLIANVTIARQGFPRMGYAACFGGPMFNTLLGLGLTYGVEAAKDPNYLTMMRLSDMAPGCLAFLVCSLLTSIIYMNITGSIARKSYGFLLYSIYFSFLIIQFLSELHIIHPLGIDHRPDIDRKGD